MASKPCNTLERYNSLLDPNLQGYFSGSKIRKHLKKSGLISKTGTLRTQAEIDEFNQKYESKRQLNNLLAKAIVMKAAELDRQKIFEEKKIRIEMEKKQKVLDARARKQRPSFTKTVSAKFFKQVEEEGYESERSQSDQSEEEASPNSIMNANTYDNVRITLPRAVKKPDFDQIYSMTKLLERKVISPYVSSKSTKIEGELPTLVHDRVQAKIYGSKPKNDNFRNVTPKKTAVKIKDINRLARSKLPNIRQLEDAKKKKIQTKKKNKKSIQEKQMDTIGDFTESEENNNEKKQDEDQDDESITYRQSNVYYSDQKTNAPIVSNIRSKSTTSKTSTTSSRPSSSKKAKSGNFREKVKSPEPNEISESSISEKSRHVNSASEPPKSILKNSSSNLASIKNSTDERKDEQVSESDSTKQSTPRLTKESRAPSKVELPENGVSEVVEQNANISRSLSSSISSVRENDGSSMLSDSSLEDEKSKKSSSFFAVAS